MNKLAKRTILYFLLFSSAYLIMVFFLHKGEVSIRELITTVFLYGTMTAIFYYRHVKDELSREGVLKLDAAALDKRQVRKLRTKMSFSDFAKVISNSQYFIVVKETGN